MHGDDGHYWHDHYVDIHNSMIISLASLEMIMVIVFGICVVKIWKFFKNHPHFRQNEKSFGLKIAIAILCLFIRVMTI